MSENEMKHLLNGFFSETTDEALPKEGPPLRQLDPDKLSPRRALQLQTAAEVSSAASSILELDKLLPLVVELIRDRFELYYVGIFLVETNADAGAQHAVLRAATGKAGQQMMKDGHRLEVGGDSMIGWCVANAEARIALDVSDIQAVDAGSGSQAVRFNNPLLPATRSEMALPLISRGNVIGAMTIQSAQPAAFSQEDITVLQTMADQLANAIENARLLEERERRITELAIVNEIGQALSSALKLDELLEIVHFQVSRLFDTTNFYVALYEPGSDHWTSAFHLEGGQQQPRARYSIEAGLTGHIIRTRKPLLFRSAQGNLAFMEAQRTGVIGEVAHSWLGVPLIAADELVGVMGIQNYDQEYLYGDEDLALFMTIAGQVANALENQRLLDESRRRAREMEVLNEVGRAITSVLDLDEVLRQIVDITKARFGHYFVSIALVEGDNIVFRHGSTVGDSDTRLAEIGVSIDLREGQSIIAEAARTGQPVLANDVLKDSRYLPIVELPETRAELTVPIEVKSRIIGTLDMQSDQPFAYNQSDVALLQSLASQAGVAIENARLFQERGRRISELAIVNEIGRATALAPELEDLLVTVHERVSRLFDTTNFYIALYNQERDTWFTALDIQQGERLPPTRFEGTSGITGHIFRTRRPLLLPSASEIIAFREQQGIEALGEQALSWLGVPLLAADKPVGAMVIQSYEQENLYSNEDLVLFSTIAAQVANTVENVRLLEETRRRAQELEVINEVGQTTSSVLDLDTLLRQFVDTIKERFGHYFAGILLIEGDQLVFRSGSLVGDSGIRWERGDLRLDLDGYGLNVAAAAGGQSILVNDVSTDPRYGTVEGLEPVRAELDTPILVRDRVIGTLTVQSDQINAFDETDVALLQSLASQVGAAIENASLFEEREVRVTELATLNEIMQAVSRELDLDQLLETIYAQVRRIMPADAFFVALYDEQTGMVTYPLLYDQGQRYQESPFPLPVRGSLHQVIESGEPVLVSRTPEEVQAIILTRESGMGDLEAVSASLLYMPLYISQRVIGVMSAQSYRFNAYDQRSEALLVAIASQVGVAIERARLFGETRQRAEEMAVLNELARVLTARPTVDEVLQETYQGVSRLLDTTNFYVGLYDPERDQVQFVINVSESVTDQDITVMPANQGLTGYVIRSRESLLIKEDMQGWHEQMGMELVGELAASWLGVPLLVGKEVLGVMAIQSYAATRLYNEHDRDLLMAIASQTAIAIQNTRLLEQSQERAEELAVLNEMSHALGTTLDVGAVIENLYHYTSRLMDVTNFYVALYDSEQDEIYFPFYAEGDEIRQAGRRRAGQGLTEHVIRTREPVLIEEGVNGWLEDHGVEAIGTTAESWLGVPMVIGEQVMGTVAVQSYTTPRLYDERDRGLLMAIASQAAIAIQNARSLGETRRRAEELRALHQVSLELAQEQQDLDIVLKGVAQQAMSLLESDGGGVWLWQAEDQELELVVDFQVGDVDFAGRRLKPGEGLTGRAFSERKIQIVDNYSSWAGKSATFDDAPFISGLAVPLIWQAQMVGALVTTRSQRDRPYSANEQNLAELLAAQAAAVIQNARLLEEARSQAEEQATLRRVSEMVSQALEIQDLLKTSLAEAIAALDLEAGLISLSDEQTGYLYLAAHQGMPAPMISLFEQQGLAGTLCDYVFQTGKTIGIDDVRQGAPVDATGVIKHGLLTYAGSPLAYTGEFVGTICLFNSTVRHLAERDLTLLEALGREIGIGLLNARLFDEEQRARALLSMRINELDCLNDIGRRIDEVPTVPELLAWVARRIPAAMQYPDLCRVAIEFEAEAYGSPEANSLPRHIIQGLYIGGERIGRICIAYTEEHDFLDEESALLGDISRRLSGYVENQRLLRQAQERADRERLTRTITDRVRRGLGREAIMRIAAQELAEMMGASISIVRLGTQAQLLSEPEIEEDET